MTDQTLHVHVPSGPGAPAEGSGTRIGAYTLVRLIGEGGFGDVYEAEQSEPVKRRVALKIVKLGMDTREVIARFELERQALARMEHPHIATVIDAGATASGRPYFVMEYVEGQPISEYAANRKLPVDALLRLFGQVCAAVGHAHTKGVIHRDLKPGNVLVGTHDGEPFAKVIDFGIAKATAGDDGERTHATQIHQVMGTPLYMSPEQAIGSLDIDVRTDIYSLGVILYELLTGTTPVEREKLASVSIADTQRLICDTDPPRPSARVLANATTLTGSATFRPADPRKLARTIRGDLDWIVMKALEKEPARRYQSAAELAEDLRRYLAGEAVTAVPPSLGYRTRKFVRRNRVVVVAASLVTLSLLVGLVAFAWQWKEAARRADQLAQVVDFDATLFTNIDPAVAGDGLSADVRTRLDASLRASGMAQAEREQRLVRFDADWKRINATDAARGVIGQNVLKPVAAAIDERFGSQPEIAGPLRLSLASRYQSMGLYDEAIAQIRIALDQQRKISAEDSAEVANYEYSMGTLLAQSGRSDAAEPYYLAALKTARKLNGGVVDEGELTVLGNLVVVYAAQGKNAKAEALYRQVLDGRRKLLGDAHPDTYLAMMQYGAFLREQKRYPEAEHLLVAAAKGFASASEPDPDNVLYAQGNLALLHEAQGKGTQAVQDLRQVVARARKTRGEHHPTTLLAQVVLGGVLARQGQFAQAERVLAPIRTEVRAAWRQDNAYWYGSLLSHLGQARAARGAFEQAEADLLEGERLLAVPHAPDEPDDVEGARKGLVDLYTAWDKAEPGKGHAEQAQIWRTRRVADDATPASPAKP